MQIKYEADVSIINIPQRLEGDNVNDLLITAKVANETNITNMTLDFSNTEFIDSNGIGTLVLLAKDFHASGSLLVLKNMNEELRDLFIDTGLDSVFNIESHFNSKIDIFEDSIDIRLDITQDTFEDFAVFHMGGVMNHPEGSRLFKKVFLLAMARHSKILLDFENLTFFDSLSISIVLNMNKLITDTSGSLRICSTNDIVGDLFKTLNIDQIIPVFEDMEKATESWI